MDNNILFLKFQDCVSRSSFNLESNLESSDAFHGFEDGFNGNEHFYGKRDLMDELYLTAIEKGAMKPKLTEMPISQYSLGYVMGEASKLIQPLKKAA